jgi:hypothetical protein
MAIAHIPLQQSLTLSTSTQEPRPAGVAPGDGIEPRIVSTLTASELPKPARAVAPSICARDVRAPANRENPDDLAWYVSDGNTT